MYIKDTDCTSSTPVVLGKPVKKIYGKGVEIFPAVPGKKDTDYEKSIYLEHLLPLEDYDLIIVLFSGGKDSLACYLKLLEMGVPKEKIELWHHDIDGGNPDRRMDWPVTQAYVEAFAKAEGVRLRKSWRQNGFWGEVYRIGASYPIQYEDNGETVTAPLTRDQLKSNEIKEMILSGSGLADEEDLKALGYRYKFPAKSADLQTRWCSSYLKIMVSEKLLRNIGELSDLELLGKRHKFPAKGSCQSGRWCSGTLKASVQGSVIANFEETAKDVKILCISGERRGESSGRAKYNEMELHRANATAKAHRTVHAWRMVIDHHEGDIWEIIRRHKVQPHPCYRAGWNRCSCMMCIFSLPRHWRGLLDLFPEEVNKVIEDERILGFTLDNKKDLRSYIGDAESCVNWDMTAISQLVSGQFAVEDVYVKNWTLPAGAFHGSDGGPC